MYFDLKHIQHKYRYLYILDVFSSFFEIINWFLRDLSMPALCVFWYSAILCEPRYKDEAWLVSMSQIHLSKVSSKKSSVTNTGMHRLSSDKIEVSFYYALLCSVLFWKPIDLYKIFCDLQHFMLFFNNK